MKSFEPRQEEPETRGLSPVLCGEAKINKRAAPPPDRVDPRPFNTQDQAAGIAEEQSQRPLDGKDLERKVQGEATTPT